MTTTNPQSETLEPGAGGHVHRFTLVHVPEEYGHSYRRCLTCLLSTHLPSHDTTTCDLCTRVRDGTAATVDNDYCAVAGFHVCGPKDTELRKVVENYMAIPDHASVPAEPWRDECGHAWERRTNIECVECPHCLFTFAAAHTDGDSDGYSCPNCEGCHEAAPSPVALRDEENEK